MTSEKSVSNRVQKWHVLGLMSGTSMDGLDCLLCSVRLTPQYQLTWSAEDFETVPYSAELRGRINRVLEGEEEDIREVHKLLGSAFAAAVSGFLNGRKVDLVGSHGQTVAHQDKVSTRQIGHPGPLYEVVRAPVVYDVRQADLTAGGSGAPLIPFLDWLLYREARKDVITLNLGGVANVSYIPASGRRDQVNGFDTGPGMGLIDECCRMVFEDTADWDGQYSRSGSVNAVVLEYLMAHPYIRRRPPKSTGLHEFGSEYLHKIMEKFPDVSAVNLLRTLVAYTAKSVTENIGKFLNLSDYNGKLILNGGGSHHPVLRQDLEAGFPKGNIENFSLPGLGPDAKEALLMAVLAVCRMQNMPGNMPSVTGASEAAILGKIYKGEP